MVKYGRSIYAAISEFVQTEKDLAEHEYITPDDIYWRAGGLDRICTFIYTPINGLLTSGGDPRNTHYDIVRHALANSDSDLASEEYRELRRLGLL